MATSKKKQMEKEKQEAFARIKQGMEKAETPVAYENPDDLVVLEIHNQLKAFLKFSLLHSWRTKKRAYIGASVICLFAAAFYTWQGVWSNVYLFLALSVAFPLLLAGLHWVSSRTQLKNDREFKETKHMYFFREDEFEGVSTFDKHTGKFTEKYENLLEAINRGDFVYLYVNKGTAFVIEKANFLKGDRETLERLLSKIKGYEK